MKIIKAALYDVISRLISRKLWALILSVVIVWGALERGVNHLYALQEWQAAVYGGMFLAAMGALAALVGKYMGIENVSINSAFNVASVISAATSHISSKEEIIEKFAQDFKEEISYRPANTLPDINATSRPDELEK